MLNLKGKTAIVSGASQGLGEAFARSLATAGANVLMFDVLTSVKTVAAEIDASCDSKVIGKIADISSIDDMKALVDECVSTFDGIDILVNNAALWRDTPVTSPWEQALTDYDDIIGVNFKGLVVLTRLCIPHMKARGDGHIINISTDYVLPVTRPHTNPGNTDLYNASKWALNGLTDGWSKFLKKDNIRVNALCMGPTDTAMLRNLFPGGEYPADMAEGLMTSEQIADLMMELMEDGRTGENIGAWKGQPIELGEVKLAHKRITG